MRHSESTKEIFKAFVEAQAEFTVAKKDSENPFFKSNYADFENVVDAAKPALKKHGLGYSQRPSIKDGKPVLTTMIVHTSGEWFEDDFPITSAKEDPQSIGAAISYIKRQALQATLGIVASGEDDDAEGAMDHQKGDRALSPAEMNGLLKSLSGIGVSEAQVLKYIGISTKTELKLKDARSLSAIGKEIQKDSTKKKEYFGG